MVAAFAGIATIANAAIHATSCRIMELFKRGVESEGMGRCGSLGSSDDPFFANVVIGLLQLEPTRSPATTPRGEDLVRTRTPSSNWERGRRQLASAPAHGLGYNALLGTMPAQAQDKKISWTARALKAQRSDKTALRPRPSGPPSASLSRSLSLRQVQSNSLRQGRF